MASLVDELINVLCEEEKLIRFEKGIYYIPTDTVLGKSVLNPRKVIEKKYINDKGTPEKKTV